MAMWAAGAQKPAQVVRLALTFDMLATDTHGIA